MIPHSVVLPRFRRYLPNTPPSRHPIARHTCDTDQPQWMPTPYFSHPTAPEWDACYITRKRLKAHASHMNFMCTTRHTLSSTVRHSHCRRNTTRCHHYIRSVRLAAIMPHSVNEYIVVLCVRVKRDNSRRIAHGWGHRRRNPNTMRCRWCVQWHRSCSRQRT